jgi:hypothetical protein
VRFPDLPVRPTSTASQAETERGLSRQNTSGDEHRLDGLPSRAFAAPAYSPADRAFFAARFLGPAKSAGGHSAPFTGSQLAPTQRATTASAGVFADALQIDPAELFTDELGRAAICQ